jgi:hypothetical protein
MLGVKLPNLLELLERLAKALEEIAASLKRLEMRLLNGDNPPKPPSEIR